MILIFNTGRQYSHDGQRIAFMRSTQNGDVLFVDADRNIEGVIPDAEWLKLNLPLTIESVMRIYDAAGSICQYWVNTQQHTDALRLLRRLAIQVNPRPHSMVTL